MEKKSIQTKLIYTFLFFGITPIIVIGVVLNNIFNNSIENMLKAQTSIIAEKVSKKFNESIKSKKSDWVLLAENQETQNLLESYINNDTEKLISQQITAKKFYELFYQQLGSSYGKIIIKDPLGYDILKIIPDPLSGIGFNPTINLSTRKLSVLELSDIKKIKPKTASLKILLKPLQILRVYYPIILQNSKTYAGYLELDLKLNSVIPLEELKLKFGFEGYTILVNTTTGAIIYSNNNLINNQYVANEFGEQYSGLFNSASADSGNILIEKGKTEWVLSYNKIEGVPLSVGVLSSMEEFLKPFEKIGIISFIIITLISIVVFVAIFYVVRKSLQSLIILTAAAKSVAAGNFDQEININTEDEIGDLATAFNEMTENIKRMIREVERSKKLALIGGFATRLSHEIRNPLTSLKMNLQMLEDKFHNVKGTEQHLQICLTEINHLNNVVTNSLRLAKPSKLKFDKYDVNKILDKSLQSIEKQIDKKNIYIEKKYTADSVKIKCSDEGLKEVFLNILINAVDAVDIGGKIMITTNLNNTSGKNFIVNITDSGQGIAAENIDKIFEPFFTTKGTGTGVGLSITETIINQHKGNIEVLSKINHGTTFVITLPI
ncbi:MAG: HAMP domain-containing protein [Bacteroidetes bacterium]|nr:HAMP domain-containing protein [Bacteroidota bacterium]